MNKTLIAGGTGFIGSHLVRTLVNKGHDVTVLSYRSNRFSELPAYASVRTIQLDLRQKQDVNRHLKDKKFETVFNLSGYIDHAPFSNGGQNVMDQHFLAVQNLTESLDRTSLRAFIQVGSSDEYGNAPSPIREDCYENPIDPYSLGKMAATHFLRMLYQTQSFPAVITRLFLAYGPGQGDRRFLPQIIKGCLQKKEFEASEGSQKRDFCYVDDIVQGLIKASKTNRAHGEIINLASGQPVAIRDVIHQVIDQCQGGKPLFGAIPFRPGESPSLFANIKKAKLLLDWQPAIPFDEGLNRTIQDMKSRLLHKEVLPRA